MPLLKKVMANLQKIQNCAFISTYHLHSAEFVNNNCWWLFILYIILIYYVNFSLSTFHGKTLPFILDKLIAKKGGGGGEEIHL